MAVWKEFNPLADKSMKDDFDAIPSPFHDKILDYLNNGDIVLTSPSSAIDIFSGERINQTNILGLIL